MKWPKQVTYSNVVSTVALAVALTVAIALIWSTWVSGSGFLYDLAVPLVILFLSAALGLVGYLRGPRLKQYLVGPDLHVELLGGVLTGWGTADHPVWFYHINYSNHRPWAVAEDVQIKIVGLSRSKAGEPFKQIAVPSLQLHWQFPDREAAIEPRPVIDSQICDLCCISKDKLPTGEFGGIPVYRVAVRFDPCIRANEKVRLAVLAVGVNYVGRPKYVEIAWDGTWSKQASEMKNHVHIKWVSELVE